MNKLPQDFIALQNEIKQINLEIKNLLKAIKAHQSQLVEARQRFEEMKRKYLL